jgi:hypothetical protein
MVIFKYSPSVTARAAPSRVHLAPLERLATSSRSIRTARCHVSQIQQQQTKQLEIPYISQQLERTAVAAARLACVGAAAAALCLCWGPEAAEAAGRKAPPIAESAGRCDVAALDKFADVSVLRQSWSWRYQQGGGSLQQLCAHRNRSQTASCTIIVTPWASKRQGHSIKFYGRDTLRHDNLTTCHIHC